VLGDVYARAIVGLREYGRAVAAQHSIAKYYTHMCVLHALEQNAHLLHIGGMHMRRTYSFRCTRMNTKFVVDGSSTACVRELGN
jgi:hypothetical protein